MILKGHLVAKGLVGCFDGGEARGSRVGDAENGGLAPRGEANSASSSSHSLALSAPRMFMKVAGLWSAQSRARSQVQPLSW